MPVIFEPPQPYELVSQKEPTAVGKDGSVLVTLTVFSGATDDRPKIAELRVHLALDHAEHLAAQLQPAVMMAKVQQRSQS